MKKILAILVSLILLLGGAVVYLYYYPEESGLPGLALYIADTEVSPTGYQWHTPIIFSFYREYRLEDTRQTVPLGSFDSETVPIDFPEGYRSTVTIYPAGEPETPLFQGNEAEYSAFVFSENGVYDIVVESFREREGNEPYGNYKFQMQCEINIPPQLPEIRASAEQIQQGDVLAIEVTHLPEGVLPVAETELGTVSFYPLNDRMLGFVPTSYNREPGHYAVLVTCGEISREIPVEVLPGDFEVQNLWIDTSNEKIIEANSPYAYQQYREAIYPLYETADPEIYWNGPFIAPLEEYRITTQYAMTRYTNGSPTPSYHAGTDLAASSGTPVHAPARGRVVFSQYLLNTGNTMVIEHGAGLKTFYFHMETRNAEEDEMVEQGELIGTVGTTGYSTGPHLHFEMRLGNQSINPWNLIEGSGGFFTFLPSPADG